MRRCAHALLLAVVASRHCRAASALAPPGGAPECPCIDSSSPLFTPMQAGLTASGQLASYGTGGCSAYDENNAAEGCAANEASYCSKSWCYVDTLLCPVNKDLCEAAGGTVGGDTSPYCRSRHSRPSSRNSSFQFSYETCSFMDAYGTADHMEIVAGTVLKVAASPLAPWVILQNTSSGAEEFGGALYDFFRESLAVYTPAPKVHVVLGWATKASRAQFASSYTACVHDVAVGNFDICIADLWRTSEREQMTQFSSVVRNDHFYLVAPGELEEDTLLHRMERPFAPFKAATWVAVAGFLSGMSLILWIMRLKSNQGSVCRQSPRTGVVSCIGDFGKTTLDIWDDFLHGKSSTETNTTSRRWFRLGFQFFLLCTLAAYTASLASMLIVQKRHVAAISDIEAAIQQDVTICAVGALGDTLTRIYPKATFSFSEWQEDAPRLLYGGSCGAMILSQTVIDNLYAGMLAKADCNAVTRGVMTEEEAHCAQGFSPRPRNDCELMRVGEILVSIPIAFPMSDNVAHSLSWAFTRHASLGGLEAAVKLNEDTFPKSKCEVEKRSKTDGGIDIKDLSGTILVSVLIVGVGMVCLAGEALIHSTKPQAPNADATSGACRRQEAATGGRAGEAPSQGLEKAGELEALHAMQKDMQALRAMYANLSQNHATQEQTFGKDFDEVAISIDDLAKPSTRL